MGWLNCDLDPSSEHEGYLVGLTLATRPDGTLSSWRFRELSSEAGDDPGPKDVALTHVQVGCDCGWRSARLEAPFGTVWVPFMVCAPRWFDERARLLWREHLELEVARTQMQATQPASPHRVEIFVGSWMIYRAQSADEARRAWRTYTKLGTVARLYVDGVPHYPVGGE